MTGPQFLGRERELAELKKALADVFRGKGQVRIVAGEPGSGKSALLAEFGERAEILDPDLVVALSECNAQAGIGDPYLAVRDLLALLTGDVDAQLARGNLTEESAGRLRRCLKATGEALVELGPDLLHLFVPVAGVAMRAMTYVGGKFGWLDKLKKMKESKGTDVTLLDQNRIVDQYCNVLKAIARQHPLLLMIDDLQWADTASIALLFTLIRRVGDSQILIVGTYRPDEVAAGRAGERHPLEKVLAELKRYYGSIEVDLDQATAAGGRSFVDQLVDAEMKNLGESFRAALFRQTGGQPLFTIELLREMRERGDLRMDEQGCWGEQPTLDWNKLPTRVEGVIEERLGRLDDDLRALLQIASVEGVTFTAQVIADIEKRPERELLRTLSQDLDRRHRLLQEQEEMRVGDRVLSRYRFTHALFRQYLYDHLGAGERRVLHREIAHALEALSGADSNAYVVQLAHHYSAAGEREPALTYTLKAGDEAARLFAWNVAAEHYAKALEFLPDDEGALAQRASICSRLVDVFYAGARPDESLHYAQLALSYHTRLGDKRAQLLMHGAIQRLYASGFWDGAKEDLALQHLEASAAIARDLADSPEKGLVYQRAAHLYLHRGEAAIAVDWARRAVDLFARINVAMGTSLGTALAYTGKIDDGVAYNEGNWDSIARSRNALPMMLLGHELTLTLALSRDAGRAIKWGERILPHLAKVGEFAEAVLRRSLALAYALSGDSAKADDCCRFVEDIESRTRFGCVYQDSAGVAYAYVRRGDWDRAKDYLDRSLAVYRERNNLAAVWGCEVVLGMLLSELGRHADAEQLLVPAAAKARKDGNVLCELWILPVLAELEVGRNDIEAAMKHVVRGFELLDPAHHAHGLPAPFHLMRGVILGRQSRWGEAMRDFELALTIHRRHGLRFDEATLLYEQGRLRIARDRQGEINRARADLESSLALFNTIGANKKVQQVAEALQTL